MTFLADYLLPGVSVDYVEARLNDAGGDELRSGKFASRESSAALAVNAFGWFAQRPSIFPSLPGLEAINKVRRVDVEYCARFPWSGGRHPWLDAVIFSDADLVGIESKRFEPFRDKKAASFADAYFRDVWGDGMTRFERARDELQSGSISFRHLDAAQLIKHAFGLRTDAERLKLRPSLFYIYAEPQERAGQAIRADALERHRREIAEFAELVSGDEVSFHSCSYGEWLSSWDTGNENLLRHRDNLDRAYSL